MRGNEIWEDILITVALLIIVPIVAILLLFIGIALLYASPIFILALIIIAIIIAKCKEKKPKRTEGKIKLISMPSWVTDIFKTIAKIILGLLVLATYLWVMINIPIWLACTITLSICGFAAGKELGKKGN